MAGHLYDSIGCCDLVHDYCIVSKKNAVGVGGMQGIHDKHARHIEGERPSRMGSHYKFGVTQSCESGLGYGRRAHQLHDREGLKAAVFRRPTYNSSLTLRTIA